MESDGAFGEAAELFKASAEDVAHAHSIILGLSASVERAALLAGNDRAALLDHLLSGPEFKEIVLPGLRARSVLEDRSFYVTVGRALLVWATSFFALDRTQVQGDEEQHTGATLLAACLAAPVLRERVDALYAPGTADGLAAAALALASLPRAPSRPGPASTSETDLVQCYRLFLGRDAESLDVVQARPDVAPADAALDFILSPEFRDKTLIPVLDECPRPKRRTDDAMRRWAEDTFDLQVPRSRTVDGVLAAILREPWVAARIQHRQPYWPSGALAAALTRVDTAVAEEWIESVALGIELLDLAQLRKIAADAQLGCAHGPAWIEFRLTGSASTADLMALRLGAFSSDGGGARLYLDYGNGYSEAESLPLRTAEGQATEVVIAAARRVRTLRWRLTEHPATLSLTLLTARPLTVEEVMPRLSHDSASASDAVKTLLEVANGNPGEAIAISLSRLMSPHPLEGYAAWLSLNEPHDRRLWAAQLEALSEYPLFSIVTPTYNTPAQLLRETINSVRAQIYPHWQLCIADDASTDPEVVKTLQVYAEADDRIKYMVRPTNGHISEASNSALELATGEWTVLLDHDDLLRPDALLALARELDGHPDAQLLYSDEDKIEGAVRSSPFFKPDYSPELLLAQNYLNHLTCHRTANIRAVGGWRRGFEGSQDYDLNLRITERISPAQVRHIPEVLYHWRIVEGSTSLALDEKSYAFDAGLRALQAHVERVHPGARAEALTDVPFYRVRPPLPAMLPRVSLIIPTRDKADVLGVAVRSILDRSTYGNYEIIIIDNDSCEAETFEFFQGLTADPRVRVLPYRGAFNYPALNNYAARLADGDIIGLVNNDIEVLTPDWIEEMVSWAIRPEIGCVGAKLLYPDMTVQHAGVVVGIGGVAGHGQKHARRTDAGYFGRLQVHSNVSAVTAACLLLRRELFEAVCGLDEQLAVAFNDVDFCLRVRALGYRNLFTPFAELIHHESKSRGVEDTPEKVRRFTAEVERMKTKWGGELDDDPFYSPNLTYETDDYALGRARRARR